MGAGTIDLQITFNSGKMSEFRDAVTQAHMIHTHSKLLRTPNVTEIKEMNEYDVSIKIAWSDYLGTFR